MERTTSTEICSTTEDEEATRTAMTAAASSSVKHRQQNGEHAAVNARSAAACQRQTRSLALPRSPSENLGKGESKERNSDEGGAGDGQPATPLSRQESSGAEDVEVGGIGRDEEEGIGGADE